MPEQDSVTVTFDNIGMLITVIWKCYIVDDLENQGIECVHMLNGIGGGHCELLLVNPTEFCDSQQSVDVLEQFTTHQLRFCGQRGGGWMHLDDLVGPGIQTHLGPNNDTGNYTLFILFILFTVQ